MSERIGENPDARAQIGVAHNKLALAKSQQPGSPEHYDAMERLVEIVANTPEALDLLKKEGGRI